MSTHTTGTQAGSMLPTPIAVEHRPQHDDHAGGGERLRVAILRRDHVGQRVDDRAVVANTAGEHVVHPVAHALGHHARG